MSIGPFNAIASAAGSPLAQSGGSDKERAGVDREQSLSQQRVDQGDRGDAAVEENHSAGDRDADGRDLTGGSGNKEQVDERPEDENGQPESSELRSRDASGELGNRLDLDG